MGEDKPEMIAALSAGKWPTATSNTGGGLLPLGPPADAHGPDSQHQQSGRVIRPGRLGVFRVPGLLLAEEFNSLTHEDPSVVTPPNGSTW
jgi:hypothetical protein